VVLAGDPDTVEITVVADFFENNLGLIGYRHWARVNVHSVASHCGKADVLAGVVPNVEHIWLALLSELLKNVRPRRDRLIRVDLYRLVKSNFDPVKKTVGLCKRDEWQRQHTQCQSDDSGAHRFSLYFWVL
jgi:hypothetical protein